MTQRLFVAVVPPTAVREAWDEFLGPRRDAGTGLRWTVPEGWHLTCAFMGEVADHLVPGLQEALTEVAARTEPFEVAVADAGAFPHPDQAKAFWLAVTEGATELGQLATRCRNAAARSGIEVAGGKFRPHLTLARANGISGTGWLEVFSAIPPQAWRVQQFALIRSRLLPGGAGYQTVAEYPLSG